jgi:hypothetical protein
VVKRYWSIVLGCLFIGFQFLSAQVDTTKSSPNTSILARPVLSDSLGPVSQIKEFKEFHPTKSPWLAVGLSAALPGAGQIYNTNYWKVPIIWGLGGYWIYEWTKLNKQYKDFGDQYYASLQTPAGGDELLRRNRDFYHDERDKFAWYLGAMYFLNLVDAYVGAHLYDFDVTPDLGYDGRIQPRVTATVRLGF